MFHVFFFFFNDTATTEIYTLSLHDALPICVDVGHDPDVAHVLERDLCLGRGHRGYQDRKSTRLNSSHSQISYAVFCLKKKKLAGETTHDMDGDDDCKLLPGIQIPACLHDRP